MIALRIVTPKGEYINREVKSIHLKTIAGDMTILMNHIPVFVNIVPCKLVLTSPDDKKTDYALAGGFLHFENNEALLLTDAIEGKEEIDLERARRAKERAEKRLSSKSGDIDILCAEIALRKAINRIHVYESKSH